MKKVFNLKRLLKMRNKSGFTLVEVIISCALLGILVMGMVMFMAPVLSMINTGQKSARATMLAETIDTYIAGCLKNAARVHVVRNVSISRMSSTGVLGFYFANENILNFMHQDNNSSVYEVRCLGICWVDNQGLDGNQNKDRATLGGESNVKKKLMLVHYTVDNNFTVGYNNVLKLQTDASTGKAIYTKVYDDMLYNGLYPVVTVESFKQMDTSGTELDTNASGYKITTDVYTDQECYNVFSEATRNKSHLSFSGTTYAQCLNMREPAYNPTSAYVDVQTAINVNKGGRQYAVNGSNYYYPDTFIYYVVKK